MVLSSLLLLWWDCGQAVAVGWKRHTAAFVKASNKGSLLSRCDFHARHRFLFRRIRRYALNSVKYVEAVDVYSPCRIIH